MFAAYTLPTLRRTVVTSDGAYLDTLRLGVEPGRGVIICHGFGGNKNILNLVALAQDLADLYTVYTFDFRGHGLSPGRSTFGYLEANDLRAVVDLAREDGNGKLAVIGFSMGGVALLRYAALYGGLDAVIVVSVPADVRSSRAPGARLIRFMVGNPIGRAYGSRRFGVMIDKISKHADPPASLVHRIAPQPLTIIHGEDDFVFEPEQARELQRRAGGRRPPEIIKQ
jgi:pimeloyl-ACP methyl ester carboxylesterase